MRHAATQLVRYGHASLQVLRSNLGRLSHPLKVNFAVTYWCQYRCKTCNIWKMQPENELSTDEILEFIRKNRRFSWVDVTGGEIFLRKDIEEILNAMATDWKRLLLLHFPTNGYQTAKIIKIVERLARHCPMQLVVTVSLDGYESLNDEIRGIRGGYSHQIDTFNALRRIPGVRALLGMTLSQANLGKFEETFRSCQRDCSDLGIEDFHLNVMQLSGHYYANTDRSEIQPDVDQARCDIKTYRCLRGYPKSGSAWLENQYLKNIDRFLDSGRTPMRCHSLRSSCFIDPWGTVYPCITYSHPIGSLRETGMDLGPIWHGAKATNTQREIWNYECPQCWTACEAYQSIAGNLLIPGNRSSRTGAGCRGRHDTISTD